MAEQELSAVAKATAVVKGLGSTAGAVVDDWISVQSWYKLIRVIGLTPGKPLQKLAEREFHASR